MRRGAILTLPEDPPKIGHVVRWRWVLRGSGPSRCDHQCVSLSHPKTVATRNRYIEWRWKRSKVTTSDRSKWRGLCTAVPLILTHKRTRHELNVKRPVNDDGETFKHLAVDSLQHDVTGLYRAAGFGRGISSHPRCRTFANRLIAQRHSIETVQSLLGHIHLDHFAPYLKISKKARRKAMADLDGFFADA